MEGLGHKTSYEQHGRTRRVFVHLILERLSQNARQDDGRECWTSFFFVFLCSFLRFFMCSEPEPMRGRVRDRSWLCLAAAAFSFRETVFAVKKKSIFTCLPIAILGTENALARS